MESSMTVVILMPAKPAPALLRSKADELAPELDEEAEKHTAFPWSPEDERALQRLCPLAGGR